MYSGILCVHPDIEIPVTTKLEVWWGRTLRILDAWWVLLNSFLTFSSSKIGHRPWGADLVPRMLYSIVSHITRSTKPIIIQPQLSRRVPPFAYNTILFRASLGNIFMYYNFASRRQIERKDDGHVPLLFSSQKSTTQDLTPHGGSLQVIGACVQHEL